MGWPKELILVRHAESEGNLLSRDERAVLNVSSHDYKITERGKKQAEITGQWLRAKLLEDYQKEKYASVYYVSYYERSRATMKIMMPAIQAYEDPRLAEAQRGIWHTQTEEQIKKNYPGEIERKDREGLYHYRPLGGENWPDVEMRVHSFMSTLNRDCEGKKVIIVVHGHWLMLMQRLIHHFSIEQAIAYYEGGKIFENTSVTIYKNENNRLVLERENFVPWKDVLK